MSVIYNLHKLNGQFSGFQDLIFDLEMLSFSESLMLLGKSSHILGPRNLERILFLSHNKQISYYLFQILNYFESCKVSFFKVSFISSGGSP